MNYIHDFALAAFLILYGLALKPKKKIAPPTNPTPKQQDAEKLLAEMELIHQEIFKRNCLLSGGVEAGKAMQINKEVAILKVQFLILDKTIEKLSENEGVSS